MPSASHRSTAAVTAASPVISSLQYFRAEYEAHLGALCPFDPYASMLDAPKGVGA